MNRQNYLITKLIEEAAEVIQRGTKALTFGLHEVQPEQALTNEERLVGELNDFLAVIEMLRDSGVQLKGLASPTAIANKKIQVERFMVLSREQGCLTDEA